MATLDETNIFGIPLTRQYGLEPKPAPAPMSEQEQASRQEFESRIGSNNKFGLTYEGFLKAKEKKLVSDQRMQVAQAVAGGDSDKALEGFYELPMVTDQFPAYMTPVLGNIIDEKERRYFAEKSGRELKDPRDVELEMLMASDPRDVKQFTTQDPVSGAMSTLAGVSSLIGIGEGPTMLKAGIMSMFPSLRKGIETPKLGLDISEAPRIDYNDRSFQAPTIQANTMDGQGGGGGGIGDIQPQPTRDYAGFISSVEKTALGPQKFGSGQDLITYLESPKRSGISTKELEYIDFDQIRNNPDLTKEDVIAHIQANRPKVYRIERSEDNPTYRADENDNPLNELPYDQEASDLVNAEEAAYFADEYGGELEKQNSSIINNPELQSSGFIVNSENIKNPTVLADLESFINRNPEAYNYTTRPLIKINYPDDRVGFEITSADFEAGSTFEDGTPYTFNSLKEITEEGATLEFPTLKEDPFDIAQEAADLRMSPDYGGQYSVYEAAGDNTGSIYKITGNDDSGYQVYVDDEPVRGDLGTGGDADIANFNDLADARGRVQAEAYDNGDIMEGANTFDTGINSEQFLDTAPEDVFTGKATLPTRFGDDDYSRYRLPMGGAENYREFTLHIENPKTTTRYDSSKGDKHFGGGDELLHYRVSDRIDEDGKRVLFVEEIQSDLHSTASSTKSDATYELSAKERQKITNQLEEFGLRANTKELKGYGNLFYRGEPGTGGEKMINIGDLPSIARDIKAGRTSKFGSQKGDEFVENFGFEKTQEIGELIEKLRTGDLPDFPYKGNDFIDLAVKDIMKLAAEGNYERVAFTNPATQLRRNSKDLEYIDSIEVNQVPFLTKAEQQFNEDFVRTSDESRMSTVAPTSLATESTFLDVNGKNRMRLDGPMVDADLNSFVSINTDFVVNNPQAQKSWQVFHFNQNLKSDAMNETNVYNYQEGVGSLSENSGMSYEDYMKFGTSDHRTNVDYIFSRADSPLTPTQVAEELQAMGIRRAKARRLKETQEAIAKMQEATPMTNDEAYDGFLNMTEAFYKATERSDSAYHKSLAVPPKFFPKKPFDQLTLDDMPVSPRELANINQETRQGISYLMGEFRRNTLPNLDSAGMYKVKTKGTGYKVDTDKFMIEKGEIQDNYKADGYADLDSMLRDLRLDKKTEAIVRKDAEKGIIPVSTTDKQIYQIEAEGGDGKKPKLIYSSLIPKSATKFAKKYNKDAEAKLKNVLYTSDENLSPTDLYTNFLAEQKKLRAEGKNIIQNKKVGQYDPDDYFDFEAHEAATIDITEEMRKAILEEGVNVMYKGGIVNKVKSMDKPIQGNRREM